MLQCERIQLAGVGLQVRHGMRSRSSPTVLFIHGFPDSSKLWLPQMLALFEAGFSVIAPDMRGYGGSDKPPSEDAYALKHCCDDLVQLLDHFGVKQACVVGHDWGAATAWRLAMAHSNRVGRLVVLSVGHPGTGAAAGGSRQRARWWYFLFFQYRGVAEKALQANNWELFREFLGIDKATEQEYIAALSAPGALSAALSWYRANFKPEVFGSTRMRSWPLLPMPVMGVWSTNDISLMEPQMAASENFVEPGKWRYVKLQGPGHWIPRDAAEDLNQLLLDFLKPVAKL